MSHRHWEGGDILLAGHSLKHIDSSCYIDPLPTLNLSSLCFVIAWSQAERCELNLFAMNMFLFLFTVFTVGFFFDNLVPQYLAHKFSLLLDLYCIFNSL